MMKAKASEMEHAALCHIRKHLQEDPEHCQKLSEKLEKILAAGNAGIVRVG